MNNSAKFFKYIAMGATGLYVYHQFKDNPRALGSGESLKLKANGLINKIESKTLGGPRLGSIMRRLAHEAIDDRMNIRDVTPKRGNNNG